MGSGHRGDHRGTTPSGRRTGCGGRVGCGRRAGRGWWAAGALLLLPLLLLEVQPGARRSAGLVPAASALELRGQTYFTSPPWKVDFRNYYWYENEGGAEYYFTIELSEKAGASLGGLQIQQTRGFDRSFGFDIGRSRAFLGLPRREGARVPVTVTFDQDQRLFRVSFPEPVPPGSTITLALRPWRNPFQADTYMFQVTAFPAGPDPVASPVGFATMQIIEPVRF